MKIFRSNPIKLNELTFKGPDGISDDIQLLRVGTFFHEGKPIIVTKKDLKTMIVNFDEGVRGIDLMLDFSHDSHKEAAAWFETLYLSEDGKELWGKVEWTEDGGDAVRKKKYRYISADFNFAYVDNETLKDHGPTLLGAGLTNRPVVKKMTPTILSEENNNLNKDKSMTEEEIKAMQAENKKLKEANKTLGESLEEKDKNLSETKIKEREAELKKREAAITLSEEKTKKDAADLVKKTSFDTMLSEGKAVEAQRESFMSDNMSEFIKNAGEVNLSEKGNGGTGNKVTNKDSDTPAQDELISLAEKMVKEDSTLNIGEATSTVLSENKELAAKYEKETEL